MMAPRNAYYNSQQTTEQRESTKVSLKWSRKVMHTLIDIHRAERTYTKHPADFKMQSRGVFHHTHTHTHTHKTDLQMQKRGVCH